MGRYRAFYDAKGLSAEYQDDVLVWCRDDEPANQGGPQVVRDIGEYRSMITGEMVSGRAQHREHLKRHGCIEVGNDTSHLRARPEAPKSNRRESLHRMLADVGDRDIRKIVKNELRNRH